MQNEYCLIHNVSFYFSNKRETNERYAILGETYFKAKETVCDTNPEQC